MSRDDPDHYGSPNRHQMGAKRTEGATIACILDLTHEQAAALSVATGRGPIGELRVTPLLSLEEVNKAAETSRP